MKKKIIIFLVVFSFIFSSMPLVQVHAIYNQEAIESMERNSDYGEKFVASIISAFPNWLIKAVGLTDPETLIFNQPPYFRLHDIEQKLQEAIQQRNTFVVEDHYHEVYGIDEEGKQYLNPYVSKVKELETEKQLMENEIQRIENRQDYLGLYTEGEFRAVALIYHTIDQILPIPFAVGMVLIGYLFLLGTFRGGERTGGKAYLESILVAVLLLKFGPEIWKFVLGANEMFVKIASTGIQNQLDQGISFLEMLYNPEARSIGNAIVGFFAALSIGVLNWQYTMRKIMIAILIIIFPLVAALSIFPEKRSVLAIWSREFFANVFMQAAHALVFAFFISLIQESGRETFWVILVFLFGINMVSGLVRRILGAESVGSGIVGGVGAGLGIASMFALGKIATKSAGSKLKTKEKLSESAEKSVENVGQSGSEIAEKTVLENIHTAGGFSSSTGSQMRNMINKTQKVATVGFSKATPIISSVGRKALQVGGATAGMVAGSIIGGAVKGNAQSGASIGSAMGYGVGSMSVPVPQNLFQREQSDTEYLASMGYDSSNLSREEVSIYTDGLRGYQSTYENMYQEASQNIENISPKVEIAKEQLTMAKASGNEEAIRNQQEYLNSLKAKQSQFKIQEIHAKDALRHNKQTEYINKLGKSHKSPPATGGLEYTI